MMNVNGPSRPQNQRRFPMDYIPDKTLFKAVMFARKMMREGTPPGVANTRAAQYYRVSVSDVAHYTGQVASNCAQRKHQKK